MNLNEFTRLVAQKRRELDKLIRQTLPRKVGAMAKAHYRDNIRVRQGFRDGGVTPYPPTRRQQSGGKSAAASYGALLSSRNHLYGSVKYTPSDFRVVVANDLIYAPVHNWGGTVSPAITRKMRKFAWAMYYKEHKTAKVFGEKYKAFEEKKWVKRAGKQKAKFDKASEAANKWKALALTKKSRLNIRIPQRQFLGESRELNDEIWQTVDDEVKNILNES